MLRQFSTKRIILTPAVDWLGTLAALPVATLWPFCLVLMGAYDGSRNATLKTELLKRGCGRCAGGTLAAQSSTWDDGRPHPMAGPAVVCRQREQPMLTQR